MMPVAASLSELAKSWRVEAEHLRGWGADAQAVALERAANELEIALRSAETEPLTLAQASKESGYSVDHLARMLRQGKLVNVGRDRAPRVRRRDLPLKPSDRAPTLAAPNGTGPSLGAIARDAIAGRITGTRR